MPRITKWSEKQRCVKPKISELWTEDLNRKYLKISSTVAKDVYTPTSANRVTLYKLIEEMMDDLFPKVSEQDPWFDKFVEVKKLDDYISF